MSALDKVIDTSRYALDASEARAELSALRSRVEQAERERDNKADSLNAWADLWAHIVKRLGGDADTLPTTANFDVLLVARGNGFVRSMIQDFRQERDEARARVAELQSVKQEAAEVVMRYYGDDIGRFKAEIVARHIMEIDTAQPATLAPRRCGTCCTEAAKAMREAASRAHCYRCRDGVPLIPGGEYHADGTPCESAEINALPLPACDCNPLKPTVAPLERATGAVLDPQAD